MRWDTQITGSKTDVSTLFVLLVGPSFGEVGVMYLIPGNYFTIYFGELTGKDSVIIKYT